MTAIVLSFPDEVLQMAHWLAVRFPLPSLLGRLIIMQVRFFIFIWLVEGCFLWHRGGFVLWLPSSATEHFP